MPARSGKSRKKAKKIGAVFWLLVIVIFLILFWFSFGRSLFDRFMPGSERKDLNEWFEVSGNEVKIYVDDSAESEYKALYSGGEVYFPYEYVDASISERFYYSYNEKLLSCTTVDATEDFSSTDIVNSAPAILETDGEVYISLDVLEKFTDLQDSRFIDENESAKRVFLYHGGYSTVKAEAKKKTKLRTAADIKAPILTDISKDDPLTITDSVGDWSRAVTKDGLVGYVKTSAITNQTDYTYDSVYKEKTFAAAETDEKIILGWQTVSEDTDPVSDLASFYENTKSVLNVVCPCWIQISDADGDFVSYADNAYVTKAHELGLKVWAVVDNFNQPGGVSDFNTGEYFSWSKKRRDFISRLINEAKTYGIDGLNLDFEGIAYEAGDSYAQFFRELSVECHKEGITLSIDNYVPYSYNEHYHLEEQAVFADYVIIMGYDEHTGTDVGSVASKDYTKYGIEESLRQGVPKEKLIEAVPFYTRAWTIKDDGNDVTSAAMSMQKAKQYVSDNGIILKWDDECGQYYGESENEGTVTKIWLEEEDSIKVKTDIIKEMDIGGIGAWRLGFESSDVWDSMNLNES